MRFPVSLAVIGLCLSAAPTWAQAPQTDPPFLHAFLFGDAVYTVTDQAVEDGFSLGQIVAHGNATLSDRVVFFGEVSVTARNTGYVLAMERAILRYDFGDALKVSVGRYHTPISYWNTTFHHGLWLQGSIARPESIRFGSRFVPVHFVGVMAEGNFTGTPFHYAVGVGNGRGENIAGGGDGGDLNGHRAVIVSASARPQSLFGFRLGGAFYVDRIADAGGSYADERIISAHAVWDRGSVEAIAEVIHVRHDEIGTDVSTESPSFYLHVGYRLPGSGSAWTPYTRYEKNDIGTGDVVFSGGVVNDYEVFLVGTRYDFDALAALKVEYRNESLAGGPRQDSFLLQASFAIPVGGQ